MGLKRLVLILVTLYSGLACARRADVYVIELGDGKGDSDLILLTGFGPFGDITDNPTGRVAQKVAEKMRKACPSQTMHLTSRVLPVRPGIIDEQDLPRYRTLIATGVSEGSTAIRVETHARNKYVDPDTDETTAIDPAFPMSHRLSGGPLPPGITRSLAGFRVILGDETSAGTYVCNDTFYRSCRAGVPSYFIHVPLIEPTRDDDLAFALSDLACRILEFRRAIAAR